MAVVAEHRHEARVPEEDVLVERSVDELRDEPAAGLRLVEVSEAQFPRLPVHLDVQGVLVVDRRRAAYPWSPRTSATAWARRLSWRSIAPAARRPAAKSARPAGSPAARARGSAGPRAERTWKISCCHHGLGVSQTRLYDFGGATAGLPSSVAPAVVRHCWASQQWHPYHQVHLEYNPSILKHRTTVGRVHTSRCRRLGTVPIFVRRKWDCPLWNF